MRSEGQRAGRKKILSLHAFGIVEITIMSTKYYDHLMALPAKSLKCAESRVAQKDGVSYLFVVLLEVPQLFAQGFVLELLVGSAEGQLVQDPPQPVDVGLRVLVKGELVFIPWRALNAFQPKLGNLKRRKNKTSGALSGTLESELGLRLL